MRSSLPITGTCIALALCGTCQTTAQEHAAPRGVQVASSAPTDSTIAQRFAPPTGFVRSIEGPSGFGAFLRELPLEPVGTNVQLYDGRLKGRQDVHAAVIAMSVGTKDLQQCADAVIRLRAEYLFAQKRYSDLHFDFTSGFRAEFTRWAKGDRIQVSGNTCLWKGRGPSGYAHDNLMSFLQQVFTYAGTLSLQREMDRSTPKDLGAADLRTGDVFIRGGSPGHAVIVVDVAHHADGRTAFLLAQSYMPAQQIHVLKNLRHPKLGAWFIFEGDAELTTPEWTFAWGDRRRWAD